MEQLLVVTGPPGAGKSSVARIIASRAESSVLVEGDAFFGFLESAAIDPWLAPSHQQNRVVMSAVGAAVGRFLAADYFTVLEGVVGPWFIDEVLRSAGVQSADYAVLLPDAELCVQRVTARPEGRFSDGAATRTVHRDFATSNIEERFTIRRPLGGPDQVAEQIEVARGRGLLRYELVRR